MKNVFLGTSALILAAMQAHAAPLTAVVNLGGAVSTNPGVVVIDSINTPTVNSFGQVGFVAQQSGVGSFGLVWDGGSFTRVAGVGDDATPYGLPGETISSIAASTMLHDGSLWMRAFFSNGDEGYITSDGTSRRTIIRDGQQIGTLCCIDLRETGTPSEFGSMIFELREAGTSPNVLMTYDARLGSSIAF